MCGITGNIGFRKGVLENSLTKLDHRGPDNKQIFSDENKRIQLGHTRLSIIDLDDEANQPFHSANGRYVMVYNGELYNYKELANKHALALKTKSDTEVILELFIKLGKDFIHQLNGMFALAIYDKQEDTTYLFRDRMGIKPLYYFSDSGSLSFASELPALLELTPKTEISKGAASLFLHRGYIPEPLTIYKNIKKFPSGSMGIFKGEKLSIEPYWKAEDQIASECYSDEKKVITTLEEILRDSISLRLMSDVPFGTFLSGGADSGLISAIAAELSSEKLKTFNVSFEDAAFDESSYASEMASIIGSDHHQIRVTKKSVLDKIDEGMKLVGEPFADSSIFPTMAVSEFASKHVKMVLSGDGGDELFMGYGAYTWAVRLADPLKWNTRKIIASLLRASGKGRNKRAAKVFDAPSKAGVQAHIFSQEQNLFSAREIQKMTNKDFIDPWKMPVSKRNITPAEEQAFFDLTNYLKDDLLVKVDRASMRYSLETRVPFLDHRIVKYALNIDPTLKRKYGETKYLVKKLMERYYPNHLIYRKKWGFSIPLEKWLKETDFWKDEAQTYPEVAKKLQLNYLKKPENSFLYNRLYALNCLANS